MSMMRCLPAWQFTSSQATAGELFSYASMTGKATHSRRQDIKPLTSKLEDPETHSKKKQATVSLFTPGRKPPIPSTRMVRCTAIRGKFPSSSPQGRETMKPSGRRRANLPVLERGSVCYPIYCPGKLGTINIDCSFLWIAREELQQTVGSPINIIPGASAAPPSCGLAGRGSLVCCVSLRVASSYLVGYSLHVCE